jgi:hypothetical protein
VNGRGSQLRVSSFICTVDGLDHAVSDDAAASCLAARQGIYTAVCEHQVHVTALASSAGPSCPRCARSSTTSRRPRPTHHTTAIATDAPGSAGSSAL